MFLNWKKSLPLLCDVPLTVLTLGRMDKIAHVILPLLSKSALWFYRSFDIKVLTYFVGILTTKLGRSLCILLLL